MINEVKTPDQNAVRLLDGITNPNIIKLESLVGTSVKRGTKIINAYINIKVMIKVINKKPSPEEGNDNNLSKGREKKYKAERPKINK